MTATSINMNLFGLMQVTVKITILRILVLLPIILDNAPSLPKLIQLTYFLKKGVKDKKKFYKYQKMFL